MAKTEAQILGKLDRPPAAHNWTLCNFQEQLRTTLALVNLALGLPKTSYFWAHKVIQITLADALTAERSIALLLHICPPSQLDDNLELLNAFLDYHEERQFQGIPVYEEFSGYFMAGPDVSVPVRPTAILRENGILKPLFVIGWANNRLKFYQRRLLTTLYDDAIFSLTDFRNSPGEVLIFPRNGYGKRTVDRWGREDYQLLSKPELHEQVERFIRARDDARLIIPIRLREQAVRKAEKEAARREAAAKHDGPRPPKG